MTDENSTRVTQAEFSRLMSVSRKTVTKWKAQGKIVMDGDLVDVPASREALKKLSGKPAKKRVTPYTFRVNYSICGNCLGNNEGPQVFTLLPPERS